MRGLVQRGRAPPPPLITQVARRQLATAATARRADRCSDADILRQTNIGLDMNGVHVTLGSTLVLLLIIQPSPPPPLPITCTLHPKQQLSRIPTSANRFCDRHRLPPTAFLLSCGHFYNCLRTGAS